MSNRVSKSFEFSRWRGYLWPVHKHELKKLIPMLLIFFFVTFNYNVLRTLKDTLLITARSSGAEVIPFVKVWAMFPGALFMTFLYTWLSNRFCREQVFYIIISIFLSYFTVFTFVLYPIRDFIHPHELANQLEVYLPIGCRGLVAMFRYWTFTLFYVMSELWSSTILSVLFWGFANQITKISEAKRFYGLFGVGANFSGIIAGQASVLCCQYTRKGGYFPIGEDAWHQSLTMMVSLILCSGMVALVLFRWMNVHVLTDKDHYNPEKFKSEGEVKGKLSLKQSFLFLIRSNYLMCIAFIVIAYNLVINLTEVLWKSQVRELFPDPNDYTLYMNEIVSIIGMVATLTSLFVANNAIRKFGWTITALITPVILLITSLGFFCFFFVKGNPPLWILSVLSGASPLSMVVFFGTIQNILSRGAKYSVFDATKEISFVPLTPESKLVGKAAIDGVCSRLGKSAGSVVHQGLLIIFSTLSVSAPYVAFVLLAVIIIWIVAVRRLGKKFQEVVTDSLDVVEQIDIASLSQPVIVESTIEHPLLKPQKAI